MIRDFGFGDLAFAQQQLDVTMVAGALDDLALPEVINPTITDVRPVRGTLLNQANRDRRTRTGIYTLGIAQARDLVVRAAQGQMKKAKRIENRSRRMLERIQQAFQSCVGGTTAVGMPTHAIDHDEQRGFIVDSNGNAILVVFPVSDQTQVSMLDPKARAPVRKWAINWYT